MRKLLVPMFKPRCKAHTPIPRGSADFSNSNNNGKDSSGNDNRNSNRNDNSSNSKDDTLHVFSTM